jgi:hypothetical protein
MLISSKASIVAIAGVALMGASFANLGGTANPVPQFAPQSSMSGMELTQRGYRPIVDFTGGEADSVAVAATEPHNRARQGDRMQHVIDVALTNAGDGSMAAPTARQR